VARQSIDSSLQQIVMVGGRAEILMAKSTFVNMFWKVGWERSDIVARRRKPE
jgi:hypothetical protein